MPVYRRKDKGPNVWQVQVSVKGQRTIKLFTGTKPEARTFERQVRADLEHQAADRRKVPTFSEFSNGAYSARARVELAAATWQNREYKMATLEQHFASLKLTEITSTHIDTFVMAQRAAGMKGSTIADYLKILRVILNFAVDQKVLRELPTFPRVKIKGSKGRQPFWTREEVDRLLASAAGACGATRPAPSGRRFRREATEGQHRASRHSAMSRTREGTGVCRCCARRRQTPRTTRSPHAHRREAMHRPDPPVDVRRRRRRTGTRVPDVSRGPVRVPLPGALRAAVRRQRKPDPRRAGREE